MVAIYKVLDKQNRAGDEVITHVISVDTYPQALRKIADLTAKNKKPNITYITGNINA